MRCPDCEKFVSFEQQDPEVELEVVDERDKPKEGEPPPDDEQRIEVSLRARCVLACAECGTELKDMEFEENEECLIEGHLGEGHELSVEETSNEATSRQDGKPGTPSRYRRTYYGASVSFEVRCSCSGDTVGDGSFDCDEQASGFNELV